MSRYGSKENKDAMERRFIGILEDSLSLNESFLAIPSPNNKDWTVAM